MPLLYYRRQYLRIQRAEASPLEGMPEHRSRSPMPTLRANGLDIGYDVHGAGPPLVMLHGATSLGREDFAAQLPLLSKAFLALPARCPRPRPDALGRGQRLPLRLARRRPRRVRRRARARVVPPARVLDGGDDGAPVRGALQRTGCGRSSSSGSRPSASRGRRVARRLMDPRRADVDDPAWGVVLARRHDAGQGVGAWQRLLPAIAADVAAQPLLTPARAPRASTARRWSSAATATRSCRSDHAWGLERQLPDGRLFVVPGLRPRGDGPPAGPVQRGA